MGFEKGRKDAYYLESWLRDYMDNPNLFPDFLTKTQRRDKKNPKRRQGA